MNTNLLILVTIGVATILLFVVTHILQKWMAARRRKKLEFNRDIFKTAAEYVDRSVKGYRNCERNIFERYASWSFSNNLFRLLVVLREEENQWVVDVVLNCSLSFHFVVSSGKVKEIDTGVEEKLMNNPEVSRLIQHLQYFDSIHISGQGIKARYFVDSSSDSLRWSHSLGGLITFARFLHHFDQRKSLRISGDAHCPFCRGSIEESESKISCLTCKTIHHTECWNEANRCTVFGCKGKKGLEL